MRKSLWNVIIAIPIAIATMAGSVRSEDPVSERSPTAKSPPAPTTYAVEGVVREVAPKELRVKIAHDEIPGYMKPMTMDFDVKEEQELRDVQPGDRIRFTLWVTEEDGWISGLQKLAGLPDAPAPPAPETFRRVRIVEPLAIGERVPNYPLTNELGKEFRLDQFRGEAYALTFVFTRCPYPDFCPRLANRFREAIATLAARSDSPGTIRFLSVTIDPDHDTPEILKRYAESYTYIPGRWLFATGALIEITALSEQLGLEFWREANTVNHNLRTAVVDRNGRLHRLFKGNTWTTEELVDALIEAANITPAPADAPIPPPDPATPSATQPNH